jgi:hypothetical protein
MPITRKPVEETPEAPDPAAYEAYLHKGGSAASQEASVSKNVRFTLEIPGPLCRRLDELRQRSEVKVSRHHWVLEAIAQRLQREAPVETP